jgi:tetratricopeptide (TPR) repeat protein
VRSWFTEIRAILRGSQALPQHDRQDHPGRAGSPVTSTSRAESDARAGGTESIAALLQALRKNGVSVIDNETLRVFNATERTESHASGSRSRELRATYLLVNEYQQRGDLKAATDYAMAMVHLMKQGNRDEVVKEKEKPPSRAAVQEMVTNPAEDQCYAENYKDAQVLASTAIDLEPDEPKSHYVLGLALRGLGRFDEALSTFDHALAAAT